MSNQKIFTKMLELSTIMFDTHSSGNNVGNHSFQRKAVRDIPIDTRLDSHCFCCCSAVFAVF